MPSLIGTYPVYKFYIGFPLLQREIHSSLQFFQVIPKQLKIIVFMVA